MDIINHTKLRLIGTYQIVPLIEYGQLARRSTILHYRRYPLPLAGKSNPEKLPSMEEEFKAAVRHLQNQWPCADAPNLQAVWRLQRSYGELISKLGHRRGGVELFGLDRAAQHFT